jgi:hypothetical protein
MPRRSVPSPRLFVLVPILLLLLAPFPALAAEKESGDPVTWSTRLLNSVYREVTSWFDSLAGVVKLGADMDPNGAPETESPQGTVGELGPTMDPNG